MNYHLHLLSKSTSLVFFLALAILFSATLKGQEAQLQNWRGIMVKVAGFVVQKVDYQLLLGSHSGDSQLMMVTQKGLGFTLDDFSMEQGTVKFKISPLGIQYEGKLNDANN